ncbi:MAG: hypothetical protein ACI8S3_001813 [Alphaproteobacteria bacterium]|jgi:hypothetical protein
MQDVQKRLMLKRRVSAVSKHAFTGYTLALADVDVNLA